MMFRVQFGSGTERSALIIVCFVSSLFLLLATPFLRAVVLLVVLNRLMFVVAGWGLSAVI
jgi:hypothetical protein